MLIVTFWRVAESPHEALFCADSSEVINTVSMAMNAELDYTVLRDTIFTHPSMSEALNDLFTQVK